MTYDYHAADNLTYTINLRISYVILYIDDEIYSTFHIKSNKIWWNRIIGDEFGIPKEVRNYFDKIMKNVAFV